MLGLQLQNSRMKAVDVPGYFLRPLGGRVDDIVARVGSVLNGLEGSRDAKECVGPEGLDVGAEAGGVLGDMVNERPQQEMPRLALLGDELGKAETNVLAKPAPPWALEERLDERVIWRQRPPF